jgi:NADH-quinone oxidoreductase subunit E
MYRRSPTGDYLVGVCTNTLCAVMGGDAILEALSNELGLHAGQTTADGVITLEHVECNAACDYAPVVMVNWEFFDNQTASSATELVTALRSGQTVAPSRGAPLCTFRQTARTLAGVGEPTEDSTGPGESTLAGLRVARGEQPC